MSDTVLQIQHACDDALEVVDKVVGRVVGDAVGRVIGDAVGRDTQVHQVVHQVLKHRSLPVL